MVEFEHPLNAKLLFGSQTFNVRIIADDLVANGDRVMKLRYDPDKVITNAKAHKKYMFTDEYYQKAEDRQKK